MSSKRLSANIVIGGAMTGGLRGAFASTSKSLTQLGAETRKLSTQQKTLASGIQTFSRMGKNVDGLRDKYARVTDQLNRMRIATDRLQRVERARDANLATRSRIRGRMMDTVALGLMAGAPIKAAIDYESSLADVAKVVDFKEPDGLKKMGRTIREMSQRLPMAASDIARIVAAGGQSGLAENELTSFAESAVKMGVAFGITADEAGQMQAEMRSAFGMTQAGIDTLADKMNYLANTTAASESKIASVVQRVGPLGEVAGLAAGEIAALGATLVGIGVDESIAATGIQNFMLALVSGEAATKAQRTAMERLGLSAAALAKGMQDDAQGTIMAVLEAVKKLPEEVQASTLSQLFGKESIKAIAPLLNVTDQLADNLAKVNDETRYAGAVQKEFAARSATTANRLQLLRNNAVNLGIVLGETVLPALNSLAEAAGPIVGGITRMAEEHPRLTKAITGTIAASVGLRVATMALRYAFTFPIAGFLRVVSLGAKAANVVTLAAGKFGGLGTIVRHVGMTLVRTPWGAAVAGLVAAGVMVWREWERVKSFFTGLWSGLTEGLAPVHQKITGFIERVPIIGKAFDLVGSAISKVFDWFGKLFTPVNHTTDQLAAAGSAGQKAGSMIASAIEFALVPMTALIDAITWVTDNIGGMISGVKGMAEAGGNMVSGAWRSTKSFLGIGDEDETQATTAAGLTPPPLPSTTVARGGNVLNDSRTINMQVHAAPGMSPDQVADMAVRKMDRRNDVRGRASLTDGAYAQ